jgi:ABC-type cobalamin/Fe3+-siderophores transport system ATPase subunit
MSASEPIITFRNVHFRYPEGLRPVFQGLSTDLPAGVVSLVGQNGTGKSTLLLLAGARVYPDRGTVTILGTDSSMLPDTPARDRLVSFVYQNMEFETQQPIGELLETVAEHGFHEHKDPALIRTLVDVFELEPILGKQTQAVSKGQLQRTIMAFSLLYGSRIVMMDEPIFALEDYQKTRALGFLKEYASTHDVSLYYSIHELELSRRYSDSVVLFAKNGSVAVGPTEEMMERSRLEEAYQVPWGMLHKKERLYRDQLLSMAQHLRRSNH